MFRLFLLDALLSAKKRRAKATKRYKKENRNFAIVKYCFRFVCLFASQLFHFGLTTSQKSYNRKSEISSVKGIDKRIDG